MMRPAALLLSLATATSMLIEVRLARAVEGGSVDRKTTHAVAIAVGGPASPSVRCSGTLLSPNVVLTVRHCLVGTSSETARCEAPFPPPIASASDFWVSTEPQVAPSTTWKRASSWVFPGPNEPCGADLALLVLATPVSAAEATPAVIVTSAGAFRSATLARTTGIAGFGSTSPAQRDPGTRRSRFDVPIRCVPGDPAFDCAGDLDFLGITEVMTGNGPCEGDSGAGALVANDARTIFGVFSRGDGQCGYGIVERTDLWRWLIASTVLDATPPGVVAPAWASATFATAPALGELCRNDPACGDGAACATFDGGRSYECAALCQSGCPSRTHCGGEICAPDAAAPPVEGGGCRLSRSGASPACGLGLAFAAVAIALVHRRSRHGSSRSSARRF